ncbi:MAG: hypothetical protein N2316_10905 [Spirochaetes bacterium]|nr:hypothetical protein [Spirochaetota bacterium]
MYTLSCGSEVTEVAWKNSTDSSGTVKDIVWAEGDAVWNEEVEKGRVSSAKEVDKTEGTVECSVYNGSEFVVAEQVRVNGQLGAVRLNEGSSQVLTLQANN